MQTPTAAPPQPELLAPAATVIPSTGLSVLYQPAQGETIVDIVFVHGLQGHPFATWATKASGPSRNSSSSHLRPPDTEPSTRASPSRKKGLLKSIFKRKSWDTSNTSVGKGNILSAQVSEEWQGQIFWPRDLLPKECPEARIMTWGYDTVVTHGLSKPTNKSNIFGHAKDLLYALDRERAESRPIIFVSHSLGGILVKEVLRRSQTSSEESIRDILESTAAVVFLGTPHRGSADFAALGDLFRRIGSVMLRLDSNATILRALGSDSPELELCRESFISQWNRYNFKVKTFQEALGVTAVNVGLLNEKVVPDTSSSLDDPREHAETIPANHMEMARFTGDNDPGYRKVGAELRRMVQQLAKKKAPIKHTINMPQLDKNQEESLRSLAYAEQGMREARIRPALANTCNWLFQETRFVNWDLGRDTDNSHGMLWIKGKPGAGKSTLMKTALHWASSKHGQDTIIASFFFNARGKEIERGPHGLYRSLLHQITKQDSAIMQWFQGAYKSKRLATRTKWEWAEEELEVLLRDALSAKRMKPIYFFVDALDECDEAKARELVQYFRMLTDTAYASGQVLKICLSSRHYPTITIDRCPEIVVEGSNNNDISTYVNSTLHSHELIHGPSVADLQESIIRQAAGIFLWVVLVVGIVSRMLDEGKESREVEGVLQKVPRDLDLLFTNILREVKHDEKERSLALIRWILFAREHLSIDSVYLAVIFSTQTPYQPIGAWPQINKHQTHPQQLARMIRNLSKGLIEVSSRGVQFIHEAVREFFVHGSGLAILENKPGSPSTALGHLTIIRGCLHHAHLEELIPTIRPLVPDRSLEQSKWAFARSNCYWFSFYAARHLYSHINEPEFAEIVPTHMKQLLASSMRRLQRAWPLWELGMIGNRIVPWKADQFTLVEEALNLVHRLMADLQNADFSAIHNPYEPDSSFMRRCLQRHVEKVPKEEQGLGLQSWTSLHRRACIHSPHPYIDELSESGHIYSRDVRGRTPLHIAAMQGNLPFARVLLQNGANPISVDAAGYTALHFASRVHDIDMCRLLLSQTRMIPNISTIIGHTPLHSAVLSGSIQVTQLLLEAGHSIDAQTCYGRTPIQIAVECGDDRLVRYLHGAGANAGLLDDQRMTALSIQENYAHWFLGMTKSLNPRVTGGSETNPKKMLASRTGHRSVVSMSSVPTSKDTTLLGDAEPESSEVSPYQSESLPEHLDDNSLDNLPVLRAANMDELLSFHAQFTEQKFHE